MGISILEFSRLGFSKNYDFLEIIFMGILNSW